MGAGGFPVIPSDAPRVAARCRPLPGRRPGYRRPLLCAILLSPLCLWPIQAPLAAAMETVPERIRLAVDFLQASQLPSGLFRYQHDLVSGRDSRKDNIVRQAGTAYALAEYQRVAPEPEVRQVLLRALDAFDRNAVDWKHGRLLTGDGKLAGAKVGATALAMLALMLGGDGIGDTVQGQRRLDAWLRGILALQRTDGGFESRPGSGRTSAYSNGEVWLALAYYHRAFPLDERVVLALQRADARFLGFYGRQPEIGFFHWGVMAAAIRYATTGDQRFRDFVAAQIEAFLTRLRPRPNPRSNSCYSVEGLAGAAAVLAPETGQGALATRLRARLRQEMEKNLALQILPGQRRIDLGPGRYLVAPEIPRFQGGFLNGARRPQLRIDATQHCLSAMLKLWRSRFPLALEIPDSGGG